VPLGRERVRRAVEDDAAAHEHEALDDPFHGAELVRHVQGRHAPVAMEAVAGRPGLFLGNHENYLESVIFTVVAPALFGTPTRALAKVEHRDRWLGSLERLLTTYPDREQDPFIVWFDQKDPAGLPTLVRAATDRSLLVHVEGTRNVLAATPRGARYVHMSALGAREDSGSRYSSSKARAELVTAAYPDPFFSHGPRVFTVRAGNVIRVGRWARDRLVPGPVPALQGGVPARARKPQPDPALGSGPRRPPRRHLR